MKKKYIILALLLANIIAHVHAWNPFSASSWESVGNAIKSTAVSAGDAIKSTAESAGSGIESAAKSAGSEIESAAKSAGSAIESAGKFVGGNISDLSVSLYDKTKDLNAQIDNSIKSLGQDFYNQAIKPASMAIYKNALVPIADVSKDLGNRMAECANMTKDSSELTAREVAFGVATGALEAAKGTAKGTLIVSGGVTQGAMIVSSGTVEGVSQTTQGVLTGVEETTKGILTAVEVVIEQILEAFDIEKLRYEGQLTDMEHGKLGNVQCTVKILNQTENFTFDLDVSDPIHSIESIVTEIVNKCVDVIKKTVKV